MNIKVTANSQHSKILSENKNKLSKQPEQVQNHRYGDHLKGCQWEGGRERMGKGAQGLKSIIGRYKTDRGMLRKAEEMKKPKNLYA